jgi:hypothetical protein
MQGFKKEVCCLALLQIIATGPKEGVGHPRRMYLFLPRMSAILLKSETKDCGIRTHYWQACLSGKRNFGLSYVTVPRTNETNDGLIID